MPKSLTILADMRRNEHTKSLEKLSDRDLCEMVRAHFESHPALPGEKIVKDQANQALGQFEDNQYSSTNIFSADEKEFLVRAYAKTRVRETPLKEGNYYLDFRRYDPTALKRHPVGDISLGGVQPAVHVDSVKVELQRNDAGEVYVLAEQSDSGLRTIGSLPENFLRNNPMNVDRCSAELQLADYSNGNMKNLSARIVVDTDLMSGDVIDLDESMLSGLEQTDGLQQ